jgi:integrase
MREPHIVPLAQQVIIILQDLHKLTGKGEWLFPKKFHKNGAKNKEPFMHSGTMNRALQYMGYGGGEFVSHGFKATASTLLNEMNYRPDWIELQLAHAERNNVRASYNHAMYMPQRKQMMQEWGAFY